MKKIIYILCVSLFVGNLSYAQEIDVPKIALDLVNTNYHGNDPETQDSKWSKVDNKIYLNYTYSDKKRTIIFNERGDFLQSWIVISTERLNPEVTKYITIHYPKATVIQAYELISNAAPERNIVDINNEETKLRLRFRPNGTFYIIEAL